MKTYLFKKFKGLSIIGLIIFFSSCDKYLSVDPPIDHIASELVFNNDEAAKSAITGVYSRMITTGFASGNPTSVSRFAGLSSDEYINYDPHIYILYFDNSLTSYNTSDIWVYPYQFIYTSNAIIEGISNNDKLSLAVKTQLEGEAKFIRAFCYFYLTNFFGDVPLHLSTNYRINNSSRRNTQVEVYQQIVKDLLDAQGLLANEYYTTERVRPNKWVATALLARVYLFTKEWIKAEIQSASIIDNNPSYRLEMDLSEVFLKNSTEAIWQLMPNSVERNTNEAEMFIITGVPSIVSISNELIGAFELGDKRKAVWTGSITTDGKTYYYPHKYKIGNVTNITEYSMVFRLAEQYLIRAEARINLNKIALGVEDLNLLRDRARQVATLSNPNPLPRLLSNLNKDEALLAVEKERRIELFSEWGHRWLDLKRTNRADILLSPIKGNNWQKTDVLYPIPQDEINANPNINQNNGY